MITDGCQDQTPRTIQTSLEEFGERRDVSLIYVDNGGPIYEVLSMFKVIAGMKGMTNAIHRGGRIRSILHSKYLGRFPRHRLRYLGSR